MASACIKLTAAVTTPCTDHINSSHYFMPGSRSKQALFHASLWVCLHGGRKTTDHWPPLVKKIAKYVRGSVIKSSLKIPPQLKHVATRLRCGGIFSGDFITNLLFMWVGDLQRWFYYIFTFYAGRYVCELSSRHPVIYWQAATYSQLSSVTTILSSLQLFSWVLYISFFLS